jgi:hypothetical protein
MSLLFIADTHEKIKLILLDVNDFLLNKVSLPFIQLTSGQIMTTHQRRNITNFNIKGFQVQLTNQVKLILMINLRCGNCTMEIQLIFLKN